MKKTNWKKITETENSASSHECYKDCDSFCCTYKSIVAHTSFIKNLATLFLTVDEFNYLSGSGRLQPDLKYTPVKIEVSDNVKFQVYTSKCTYEGMCPEHKFRPFFCKLYPAYPQIGINGEISSYSKGKIWQEKIFDQTPCTIHADSLVNMNTEIIAREFFNEPKNIFYFKCIEILNTYIEKKIMQLKKKEPGIANEQLIEKIEIMYLKNKLLEFEKINKEVEILYDEMLSFWGSNLVLDV
jgi:hypothetical protein